MNTDDRTDLARGKNLDLLLKHETEQILGCAFDVLNEVGHGFHEKMPFHPC
jgi:hypothetical protein